MEETRDMEFRAEARFMRVSPQKAGLVMELIRGQRAEEAINTLTFTRKRVAVTVLKLLRSAIENANHLSQEKSLDVDLDQLYVKRAVANEGPRLKRIRPAPMGRAFRYQRRMSHLEIALEEKIRGGRVTTAAAPAAKANTRTKSATKPAAKKSAAKPAAKKKTAAK